MSVYAFLIMNSAVWPLPEVIGLLACSDRVEAFDIGVIPFHRMDGVHFSC